jgi:RNA-binding protein
LAVGFALNKKENHISLSLACIAEEKLGYRCGGKMMPIKTKQRLRLREEMSGEHPTIWMGKKGITQEVIEEVSKQLDQNEVVKVRMLKSALQTGKRDTLAHLTAEKTGAELIEVRGNTFIIYRRRRLREKPL